MNCYSEYQWNLMMPGLYLPHVVGYFHLAPSYFYFVKPAPPPPLLANSCNSFRLCLFNPYTLRFKKGGLDRATQSLYVWILANAAWCSAVPAVIAPE